MKLKMFLLDADYIEDKRESKVTIRLFGKTKNGKNVVALCDYQPYFYVLPSNVERAKKEIQKLAGDKIVKMETVERILGREKKKFIKIYCKLPQDTQKIRDIVKKLEKRRGGSGSVIEEYEYSINFYRRFLIDKNLSLWIEVEGEKIEEKYDVDIVLRCKALKNLKERNIPKLKVLAFDIEVLEKDGKRKVSMISLFGNDIKKVLTYRKASYPNWVECLKDEKEMIERFVEIVRDYNPDIIVTFNGDSFDFPILIERAEEFKVSMNLGRDGSEPKFSRRARMSSARIAGKPHIDAFVFINNILSPSLDTEVLTLNAVSTELLDDHKIEMQYEEMLEAWYKNRDMKKFAEYCLKDSELTFRLLNLLLPQIVEISGFIGQTLFDTSRMTYSQIDEWYLSRKVVERNMIIPNQPKWEEIQKRRMFTYTGGYVKEPIAGIHENISVIDFRSLYPSIIATFNISPEMFNAPCKDKKFVPGKNYWFCGDEEGFISGILTYLIKRRAEVKKELKRATGSRREALDREQHVLKIIANSMYGYYAFPGSKWYCKECAEAAAAFGRHFIKFAINEAEKFGFKVIYSDTDSCFIKSGNDTKKKTKEFLQYINKKLPGLLEVDFQGFYKRGIFISRGAAPGTAKKRYALLDENGNLLIRGLETVRRDWCNLAKEVQRKVLEFVLSDNDVEKAVKYVKNVIDDLKKHKVPLKELVIHEQLTKPIEEYKQIGPHVVAAKKLKQRGEDVFEGMIIRFVITKGSGSISKRAEPVDYVTVNKIDESYYIKNQIVPAALRVLQVLGIEKERFLGGGLKKFLS
ncbi:MAG: ribonuclease H-like domain-containing protein [Candidatus Aenigmarchaeota archaeon]|nr:ribonuclease H-like domain-containing protein [Candidatus Aenigmarchaeota archaeon]